MSAAKTQCSTPEGPVRVWRSDRPVRLEQFLQEQIPDASRDSVRRALAAGACRVDGMPRPWGYHVAAGAEIVLDASARISRIPPENLPLEILYEDEELIAVNKPSGMLVHPTTRERTGTAANALRGLGLRDVHFLHRLDRGTSGVLLAAKHLPKGSPWARLFASRAVEKQYLAVVAGPVTWEEQTVDAPIGRDPDRTPPWNVDASGAFAQTHFRVLERAGGQVFLAANPVTGRTNQIRIHCAAIGLPILGDTVYGGGAADRLLLHAWRLSFPGEDGQERTISAPAPAECRPPGLPLAWPPEWPL